MVLEFEAVAVEWRGPAPFVFVPVPEAEAAEIREAAKLLTYGWGCIPVNLQVGATRVKTSLFPRNGTYFVPLKVVVQRQEGVGVGDLVAVRLEFAAPSLV